MKNRKNLVYKSQICWEKICYKKILLKNLILKILSQDNLLLSKIPVKKPIIYNHIICYKINKNNIKALIICGKNKILTACQKKLIIIFIFSFFSQIQNLKAEILVENIKNDSSIKDNNLDVNKNISGKGNFDIGDTTEIRNKKTSFDCGLSLAIAKKFSINLTSGDIILHNQIFGAKNLGFTDFVSNIYGYKLIFSKKIQKFYYGFDINLAKIKYQKNIYNNNQNNPKYSILTGLVFGFEVSEKINFQINLTNNYLSQKLQNQKTQINQLLMGLVYDF